MCGWASLLASFFVSALTRSWATGLKFYGLQRYSLKISFGQGGAGAQFRRQSGPPVQTWSSNPERPGKKTILLHLRSTRTHAKHIRFCSPRVAGKISDNCLYLSANNKRRRRRRQARLSGCWMTESLLH